MLGAARFRDTSARTVVTGIADREMVRSFRLRPIMKQGTASSIPETWKHYSSVEDARRDAKNMYHNDRVMRVMLVVDGADRLGNGSSEDRQR